MGEIARGFLKSPERSENVKMKRGSFFPKLPEKVILFRINRMTDFNLRLFQISQLISAALLHSKV